MNNTRELRSELLVILDERIKKAGIEQLSKDELTFWAASYSLGLIRNEGLHGFLFWFDDILTRDMSVAAFFDIEVEDMAIAVANAGNLLLEYLENKTDDEVSAAGFRKDYEQQLDNFEKEIAPLKSVVEDRLVALAEKVSSG